MITAPTTQLFSQNPLENTFPGRSLPLIWLLVITALFFFLRLPHINHPLAWDEAWILCALKSLVEGGDGAFQNQLWRHPPMYLGLGLLLSPLKLGFAQRMEMLGLIIHTGALLIFVVFIAKILGRRIALFTGLAYAMLPGSIFFSTWIKRDCLVILFCLFALWAFIKKRDLLAGIFLGLSFLSKESAVFYTLSICSMVLLFRPRNSIWKTLIAILAPIIVISGWWYLFYATGTKGHLSFFQGASAETSLFSNPWWYYFVKLRYDLGIPGLMFFTAGLVSLVPKNTTVLKNFKLLDYLKKPRLLPIHILFPGYLILTLSHGKPPWMTIVFFPFLALVIGLGWQFLMSFSVNFFSKINRKRITIPPVLASLPLIALLSLPLIKFNYIGYLSAMSPGTASVIQRSYRIAEAVNQASGENDKLLVMPMIIQPHLKNQADPILFWRLKPSLRIFRVIRLDVDFNSVKKIIVAGQINRLLIFPVEGSTQEQIVLRILNEINPTALSLPGKTLVINVEDYWKNSDKSATP